MDSGHLQSTYNKLQLLRRMLVSREGDRREGVLLRQSKGWFHVGAMGHEALAVLAELLRKDGARNVICPEREQTVEL